MISQYFNIEFDWRETCGSKVMIFKYDCFLFQFNPNKIVAIGVMLSELCIFSSSCTDTSCTSKHSFRQLYGVKRWLFQHKDAVLPIWESPSFEWDGLITLLSKRNVYTWKDGLYNERALECGVNPVDWTARAVNEWQMKISRNWKMHFYHLDDIMLHDYRIFLTCCWLSHGVG